MTVAIDDENTTGVIPPTPLQAKKIVRAAVSKMYELVKEYGGPPDAAGIVKEHIRLLHDYNEIKDVGQGLIGLIAQSRGVRHIEVQTEFGIATAD
ncbi:hypothetical protein A7C99_1913 [Trichophyton rubrum]|uniref:DNA repair protein Swi5/Sae3 n=1 Tax=Trichophyton rubrum TaxID=5551 RepID=A0A178F3E3_TRIRU|nr:hypothetical protein A7C99_1913 [Trichophyton rubrum]